MPIFEAAMPISKIQIDYSRTGYFSKLILDYLAGAEAVKPFYRYSLSIESFQSAIEAKSKEKISREALVEALKKQNSVVKKQYPEVAENIELLGGENTFTVTTAHQPNLFTGYLYFIYKIVCTINLSEQLKEKYPQYHFVPVFWLNTEDHDFAEINHIHLFSKKIEWKTEAKGAVGRLSTGSLNNVLEEVKQALGDAENAQALYQLINTAYPGSSTLGEATRCLVNELFGEYGLVVIDSDDKQLKEIFAGIMEDEVENQRIFHLVNETNKELEAKGYEVQAKPREINLFYLGENSRERVLPTEAEKAKAAMKAHPEQFSPNVLLRCLFQEKVLPNLACIGGGGELAYWLQMKKVFEYYQVNFPVLLLRNSVLWIDKNQSGRMKNLGFDISDLFVDTDSLVKKYMDSHAEKGTDLENEKRQTDDLMKSLLQKATSVDITLEQTVAGEHKKILTSLEHIESKIAKAQKRKHETEISRIKALKEKLFPGNELQERYENFFSFYLKYEREFIKLLLRHLNVFDRKFSVFLEE